MKRIVVVDDNEDILDLIRVILETAGYVVETCQDRRSLQRALRETTDLILLDVFLHDDNGCEVCRQLKQDEHVRHVPIVLISAHLQAREALAESQANGFLEKPFHVDELLASIKQHV